ALTSDHGVCPIPELSRTKGIDAQRVESSLLFPAIEEFLDAKYGIVKDESSKWINAVAFPWLFLNYRKIAGRKLDSAAVAGALAGWLKNQSWAAAVYTREQLEQPAPAGDPYFAMMKKGYHP